MQLELRDKRALITGGSAGIGKAIAEVLIREGCRVTLNGRNSERLAASVAELSAIGGIPGDVTMPGDASRVVAESVGMLGGLDILVCNVGSGQSVPAGKETYEEWQRVLALNFLSTTNMVEAARAALGESRGVVICISSICGSEIIEGAPVTYSVAKAALNAYVRGISRPLGDAGIRIAAVAPGNILFAGSVWERRSASDPAGVSKMLESEVALGKLGDAADVANLVAFLASPRSSFATGSVWTLDGGQVRS